MGTLACSLWGLLSGVLLSVVYILVMGLVKSQEASSLVNEDDLVGCTGRITVAITPGALGEVSCSSKSQTVRRTVRATHGGGVAEGTLVRIKEIQGDVLVVEELP